MGKSSSEGWGLGLLLVFFPDEQHNNNNNKQCEKRKSNNNSQGKWSYASPFGSSTTCSLIHSRAQSTLSICVLIVFFTLFLFTLSTFDRTLPPKIDFPRRLMLSDHTTNKTPPPPPPTTTFALQGLGTQYRRGTRAMPDLVVAHLTEDTNPHHLKLFLRTLHRSGLTSRADVLFIFPNSQSPNFTATIHQENHSFSTLINRQTHHNNNNNNSTTTHKISSNFEAAHFVSKSKNGGAEPIWGTKQQHQIGNGTMTESTRPSWGSVVGFESAELDPENSLAGFTDGDPPMRLRRWACYPMLLGRLRRNFKHVLLADVKEVVLLGDPLGRVRTRPPDSVSVWTAFDHSASHHNNKNRSHWKRRSVTADVIAGGIRGIRRLSVAVLNEIVRSAVKERRGKGGAKVRVSDSAVLSQLVRNESLLKSVNVDVTELVPSHDSVRVVSGPGGVGDVILKEICGAIKDASSVYSDC
ncbi:hypothetical protein Syun_001999 [Stephania yunnanensis]|uniref:DUF7780 domain-containing protein n=1 Tax=Stephania yunnanensis TaxID=152371 RepID=A0AAP0LIY9_9MAGN